MGHKHLNRIGLLLTACLVLCISAELQAQFFTIRERDHKWWLIDPTGKLFFSTGVNVVDIGPPPADFASLNSSYCGLCFYPSTEQWANDTSRRLKLWGFNSIGSYSSESIIKQSSQPYTISLWLGRSIGAPYVDVHEENNRKTIAALVQTLEKYRNDPKLIGYFLDNELGWWDETIFTYFAKKPWDNPLKKVLWKMIDEEYADLPSFRADFVVEPVPSKFEDLKNRLSSIRFKNGRQPPLIDRFVEYVANDYYKTMTTAVRNIDPNHLILCDRYADFYSDAVVRAAGRYCDAISVNYNTFVSNGWISPFFFETLYKLSGKPIMVSEFYFSAMENRTGNSNSDGPFIVVPTQAQRASSAAKVAEQLARMPFVIGYHWFQFADEPAKGRQDGEDFNFGLVDIHNAPYRQLVTSLAEANRASMVLHRAGPEDIGLVKSSNAWQVPRVQCNENIDGRIDEWNLPRAWIRDARSKEPFSRFGDFYLSWAPQGLLVSVLYEDYNPGKADVHSLLDQDRLFVTVGHTEKNLARFVLKPQQQDRVNHKKTRESQSALIPVNIAPTQKTSTGRAKIQGEQRLRGTDKIMEVLIPASLLGTDALHAGDVMRFGVTLSLRGNVKEIYWPVSLSSNSFLAEKLASIQLAK